MSNQAKKSSDPNQQPVKVVKIKPYPIPCDVYKVEGAPPLKGNILKLTQIGFLMRVITDFYKAGDDHLCQFELPGSKFLVSKQPIKVIKTYDLLENNASTNKLDKVYTVEFHFKNLPAESKKAITQFLSLIGQK